MMANHVERIRSILAAEAPSSIVDCFAEQLQRAYGVTEVELLLVDYRLSSLLPVLDGGASASLAAWRCFDEQAYVVERGIGYAPVSVRGDRLGVLRVAPAERLDGQHADLATLLAHELASARDHTDRYLVAARERRLTLAAEMQWELLPGRCCSATEFELAGQLEPAYAVKGDTFDWSVATDRLTIAVLNGMGDGVDAAALSVLATSGLRNARRAGLDLTGQAELADSALYAQHAGARYVSALLLGVELATGLVSIVDAGSPLLMRVRDGVLEDVALAAQDPLGMFDGTRYTEQRLQLESGDRLVAVSDGVHEAAPHGGGSGQYGEAHLRGMLARTRDVTPLALVRAVVAELHTFVLGELADDAAVVCLDWHGRGSDPSVPAPDGAV
jgi:serine phosphatase RsbU (regulator of sigma subunit)